VWQDYGAAFGILAPVVFGLRVEVLRAGRLAVPPSDALDLVRRTLDWTGGRQVASAASQCSTVRPSGRPSASQIA
jgi:hypothetical protein